MPSTHSKPVQKKNAETNNHRRKWEKKLRYAKTEEQRLKAEQMIRIHTPKEKLPKEKVPKKPELTEDQLLDQMVRENKKLRKNPDFIEQQTQAELKRQHLEQERQLTRKKIKNSVKERKEQEEQETKKKLEAFEQRKKDETTLTKHLESHKQFLLKYSEKTGVMETFLDKHKGNKKKATKEFKSQTTKMCRILEYMICEKLQEGELSYDEVKDLLYENMSQSMERGESSDLKQLTASL
jgi:hypothetical protein